MFEFAVKVRPGEEPGRWGKFGWRSDDLESMLGTAEDVAEVGLDEYNEAVLARSKSGWIEFRERFETEAEAIQFGVDVSLAGINDLPIDSMLRIYKSGELVRTTAVEAHKELFDEDDNSTRLPCLCNTCFEAKVVADDGEVLRNFPKDL